MPLNRRELVRIGGVLGGAALVAAKTEGTALGGSQAPVARQAQASGRVARYGEGSSTYFTLSEMPEEIVGFSIESSLSDRLGRLVLAAAEKRWTIHVAYFHVEGQKGGTVYDVRVEDFGAD